MNIFKPSFDFEKLIVYQKAELFYIRSRCITLEHNIENRAIQGQLTRASLSIPINIAEGFGRTTYKDKRHFLVISRASTFESASLIRIVHQLGGCDLELANELRDLSIEISKMLNKMIRQLDELIKSN